MHRSTRLQLRRRLCHLRVGVARSRPRALQARSLVRLGGFRSRRLRLHSHQSLNRLPELRVSLAQRGAELRLLRRGTLRVCCAGGCGKGEQLARLHEVAAQRLRRGIALRQLEQGRLGVRLRRGERGTQPGSLGRRQLNALAQRGALGSRGRRGGIGGGLRLGGGGRMLRRGSAGGAQGQQLCAHALR